MRVAELKDPAQVPGLLERMTTVVAGMTRKVGVQRYTRKDGNYVELDITSSSSELDGRLVVVAACIDVTYARRVEEQLRQAAKMEAIGQLAGGVAHDFNNILAAILANVELARDTLGDRHPVALEIGEIEKASHRAVQLTRQLLTFSRKEQREVKPLGLASVVRQVEKMLARLVGENVQIATVTEPALGTIEADGGQLEQLIVNLVVNARDAMPDGGQITLETANVELDQTGSSQVGVAPGRYVMLAVSDTGCGMDAATQARIFEPFFTTKEVGKGTGLGLATVFGIVKQSEGGVSVYSEVGRGSTFKLYFPRVDRMRKPTLEPGARTRFALGSGTVLLVEDDEMLRSVIRRQLTAWGYSLLEARDAGTALAIVKSRREPIDLLFTDLVMPGVDGRALAREVIAEHPSIKVLFMSGYTEHAAVRTATLGPTDHFIPKPFTGTMLSHAILRALGLTSQER
jgi:signal transduction histidine kinase/CheY-like chemotaxis protein